MSTHPPLTEIRNNKSHQQHKRSLSDAVEHFETKIRKRGDLPKITVCKQLDILHQLAEFPFGRYILQHLGADGFWTDHLLRYPSLGLHPKNEIENFLFFRSPLVLAHRERLRLTQDIIQNSLGNGFTIASIPCGFMRDILTLDFSNVKNVHLIGIDIDLASLSQAHTLAHELNISAVEFLQKDAWQLESECIYDLISSSGLNVYEVDPYKVLDLYNILYKSLKPGGKLLMSVLTHPPYSSEPTDWLLDGFTERDLLLEETIYHHMLELQWRNFRHPDEIKSEFLSAGFHSVDVHYDAHHIFPIVIAHKAL